MVTKGQENMTTGSEYMTGVNHDPNFEKCRTAAEQPQLPQTLGSPPRSGHRQGEELFKEAHGGVARSNGLKLR